MHNMAATWTPPATFAARLRDAREQLGLTIEQAAEQCGLSRATWSTWERGVKPRGMNGVVERICEGLARDGVPLDPMWLMFGRIAEPDSQGGHAPSGSPVQPNGRNTGGAEKSRYTTPPLSPTHLKLAG